MKKSANKNMIIGIIIIILIVIVLIFVMNNKGSDIRENEERENPNVITPAQEAKTYSVAIVPTGFSPNNLEINQGDSVIFVNRESKEHWPASNLHPTHKQYPGSDRAKCGTEEEVGIFDACKGLNEGESFRFTFNEKGTWRYHDHLMAEIGGTIVVK